MSSQTVYLFQKYISPLYNSKLIRHSRNINYIFNPEPIITEDIYFLRKDCVKDIYAEHNSG